MIHQCVDEVNFENISGATTSKDDWDNLEKIYEGAENIKKVSSKQCEYNMKFCRWSKVISSLITSSRFGPLQTK